MDFYKVPIGFGLALAMNHAAMEAYAAMTGTAETDHSEQSTQRKKRTGNAPDCKQHRKIALARGNLPLVFCCWICYSVLRNFLMQEAET